MNNNSTKTSSLAALISVFFFWGFVAASNSVLLSLFKEHFDLKQWQSQLVEFAFYISYTFGALVYFAISVTSGDPLNKIGYKKGLIIGLCVSAVGALGFIPATMFESYALMLTALFVVGLGFALQQIVANPYMIALGNPSTGAHRVSLAGGVNSLGTTIGPLLLAIALYGGLKEVKVDLEVVKMPYIVLAGMLMLCALILGLSKLPPVTNSEKMEHGFKAFEYPQLIWGMVAIFVYVGVEVTIQSNLPALMEKPSILGIDHKQTVHFISLYWGSLMIGRWVGALTVFNLSKAMRQLLTVIVPFIAFAVVVGANYAKLNAEGNAERIYDLLYYAPLVLVLVIGFFMANEKPARTMILFGSMAAIMMLVGLFTTGRIALYAFISGGLFCSVMWPCIFSLSIAGLGKYTAQASSLLIMMIAGGAAIPPLQGLVCDMDKTSPGGVAGLSWTHFSYIIPVFCFGYLAFFGWKVKGILKSQGIDYDAQTGSAH